MKRLLVVVVLDLVTTVGVATHVLADFSRHFTPTLVAQEGAARITVYITGRVGSRYAPPI